MTKLLYAVLVLLSIYIFRNWFFLYPLSGQDLFFIFADRLKEFSIFPYAWETVAENGLGDNAIKFLWTDRYMETIVWFFVNKLGISWELVQRLFWLWPYLILSIVCPFFLLKNIMPSGSKNIFLPVGILIFSFNTYILMVVSGGQINLGIAYAMTPIVLYLFINGLTSSRVNGLILMKRGVTTGLILVIQILFDLRMAYVTMMAVGIYFVVNIKYQKSKVFILNSFSLFGMSLLVAAALHFFWLLPQIIVKSTTLPLGYESPGWLSFLSWAKFSESLSLLHPNWPENIFGKTYFMRLEFLGIPLLAYGSLLFINGLTSSRVKKLVLFFVLLGLLGAFLGKGVNPPFGEVYQWLFSYLPLFWMFRDPTKFYLLVSLSYTVLISLSLFYITNYINSKLKTQNSKLQLKSQKFLSIVVTGAFFIYWLFLLVPVFTGQVKGTLARQETPKEYQELADFLSSQKNFSRILWVPKIKREAYYTNIHPKVSAEKLFNTTDLPEIIKILSLSETRTQLQNLAIKYIIVPYDFDGQIFLTEREYDENLYQKTVNGLTSSRVNELKRVINFGKLVVFEVEGAKDHFYVNGLTSSRVKELMTNPTKYEVMVEGVKKGEVLVFSERFDKGWVARITVNSQQSTVNSQRYDNFLNSFLLNKTGSYTLEVFYEPQKYVVWGSWVSLFSLALVIAVLVGLSVLERRNL